MRSLLALLSVAAITSLVSAQQASFTNYGRGCDLPSNPPPLIRSTGLPQIGASFTVTYIGPNGTTPVSMDQPVLLTGFMQATIPVPPISALQPTNCTILLVPSFSIAMPLTGSRYQDRLTVQIPNDVNLIGATYHQQFADLYSRCSPNCQLMMVRTSDAATIVIGL